VGKIKKEKITNDLIDWIVIGMQDKKAFDIVVMDMTKIKGALTDYFVVCSANSDSQVDAIYQSIDEKVFQNVKEHPVRKEGFQNKEWILMDYVDVVIHIFRKDKRAFYAIEDLWGDATIKEIPNLD
jgi:ribosome-associated protein